MALTGLAKGTSSAMDLTVISLRATKGDQLVTAFKGLDPNVVKGIKPSEMTDILKSVSDVDLAKIGKNLDPKYVQTLDPKLAAKLKPGIFKVVANSATKAGGAVAKVTRGAADTVGGSVAAMRKSFPQFADATKSVIYKPMKNADGTPMLGPGGRQMVEITAEGTQAGQYVTKISKVEMTPAQVKKLKDVDELVETVPAARQGLMKTGMYVAGGTVFLMMLYDTLNPFEAIQKAVKNTGQTVRGLKEVAGEAAEAVVGVAKGGFNFVSFVTKNSGLSSSCSILCLILIFAMVMMGFMGGGKNK
jgi:hypothetical protein